MLQASIAHSCGNRNGRSFYIAARYKVKAHTSLPHSGNRLLAVWSGQRLSAGSEANLKYLRGHASALLRVSLPQRSRCTPGQVSGIIYSIFWKRSSLFVGFIWQIIQDAVAVLAPPVGSERNSHLVLGLQHLAMLELSRFFNKPVIHSLTNSRHKDFNHSYYSPILGMKLTYRCRFRNGITVLFHTKQDWLFVAVMRAAFCYF